MRLASSSMDESRQPLRPPTVLVAQMPRAFCHNCKVGLGDFSQTSPVSLSRTASPPMTHLNRLELQGSAGLSADSALSQVGGSPLRSTLPVDRLAICCDNASCCVVWAVSWVLIWLWTAVCCVVWAVSWVLIWP